MKTKQISVFLNGVFWIIGLSYANIIFAQDQVALQQMEKTKLENSLVKEKQTIEAAKEKFSIDFCKQLFMKNIFSPHYHCVKTKVEKQENETIADLQKITNKEKLPSKKNYILVLQNRFYFADNRDLQKLDESSIYTIEKTDDRFWHFSQSLFFSFWFEKNLQHQLVASGEIFLPWSTWTQKAFSQQQNFKLLLHSLYYHWQKDKTHSSYHIKLGRFFFVSLPAFLPVAINNQAYHGVEVFIKIKNSYLRIVPLNIDSPLATVLGDSKGYFFANKDSFFKNGKHFRGDFVSYAAELSHQTNFDILENSFFYLASNVRYTRRGAFAQGNQRSDHGRLSNRIDHDYLVEGDLSLALDLKRNKTNLSLFSLASGSYGIDNTYNFKIPLNGLSMLAGILWKSNLAKFAFSGKGSLQWISPPAFYDSGWLKTAGYTSSQKRTYGGILLNDICQYSPHAQFDFEKTNYLNNQHCFQLPADFVWQQDFAFQVQEPSQNGQKVFWNVLVETWLFASLTRYSKTLKKKFSTMGNEWNISIEREVQNKIQFSAGIFFPLEIAKSQSKHFASHLWKGGRDFFYGFALKADFYF